MRTTKQNAVMAFLRQHGQMTLSQAVELIGGDVYANQAFHVGNVLRRMIARGMIRRVKRGVYAAVRIPETRTLELSAK
jgi:predicted transcriptional regulator of viral defense system